MFPRFAAKPRSCSDLETNVNRFVLIYKQNLLMIKRRACSIYGGGRQMITLIKHTHTHTQGAPSFTLIRATTANTIKVLGCFETLIPQTKDYLLIPELEPDQPCLHTNQIKDVKYTAPAFVHTFLALQPPCVTCARSWPPLLCHPGSCSIYGCLEQTLPAEK